MIIGDRRPTDSVRDLVRLIKGSPRCSVEREGCKKRVKGRKEGRKALESFGKGKERK